jgi:NAD(P)-dependent dehydrogenase (short-subunit alcohol dehydrogenase family)
MSGKLEGRVALVTGAGTGFGAAIAESLALEYARAGAVVVASALTIGAELDVEAERFRRAVEVGYEAMTRLGAAIDGAQVVYRGVWPTCFGAPFAAAAVVASLLEPTSTSTGSRPSTPPRSSPNARRRPAR